MKYIVYALALIFTLNVAAQEEPNRPDRKERMEMRKGKKQDFLHDLTPEQIAELKTKKLTLKLNLSDNQQRRVLALATKEATIRKQKMEARKAMKANNKELTSDEKFTMMNERLEAQIAYKRSMKEILTAEQFEQWEKMRNRKNKQKLRKHGKRSGKK